MGVLVPKLPSKKPEKGGFLFPDAYPFGAPKKKKAKKAPAPYQNTINTIIENPQPTSIFNPFLWAALTVSAIIFLTWLITFFSDKPFENKPSPNITITTKGNVATEPKSLEKGE